MVAERAGRRQHPGKLRPVELETKVYELGPFAKCAASGFTGIRPVGRSGRKMPVQVTPHRSATCRCAIRRMMSTADAGCSVGRSDDAYSCLSAWSEPLDAQSESRHAAVVDARYVDGSGVSRHRVSIHTALARCSSSCSSSRLTLGISVHRCSSDWRTPIMRAVLLTSLR